ncbi:MAG: alpha/beta hydrolase, partial [Cellulomonas sp.]|nr:alpha/beta hydrolase [Cellulomonas sp.]
MASPRDLVAADGRTVRCYDTGDDAATYGTTVLWHHGSPQTGAPLEPLVMAAAARGIRLLSYARPSYGGSSPKPGRDVASAAAAAVCLARGAPLPPPFDWGSGRADDGAGRAGG